MLPFRLQIVWIFGSKATDNKDVIKVLPQLSPFNVITKNCK